MAQRRGGGNDGDGRREGDGHCMTASRQDSDRRHYGVTTAMTSMDGHDSDGDGRRNGNGDGRLNGDCDGEVTKLMYSATATAMAMDGATATRWRPGQRNGNRRRNGDTTAMTLMDCTVATAMDGTTTMGMKGWTTRWWRWPCWTARRQRPSRDRNSNEWRNKHNNQLSLGA